MILRRLPADFVVEERLLPGALAAIRPRPGPGCVHAIYRVDKAGLTTPDAVRRLARELGVNPGAINYAGLKDKHAVTTQHMSVRVDAAAKPGAALPPAQVGAAGDALSARRAGWCSHPITSAWIGANVFTITLRDVTADDAARLATRAEALRTPEGVRVLNLFGSQRFGSARHGAGFAAVPLVKGDFEGALRLLIGTPARKDSGVRREFTRVLAAKWGAWAEALADLPAMPERGAVEALARGAGFKAAFAALPAMLQQMAVDAYQSHVWNRVALALVKTGEAGASPELRLPMPAPGLIPSEPWGPSMVAALAEDGLSMDALTVPGLRRPTFGSFDRALWVCAGGFALDAPEPDELSDRAVSRLKVVARFELPSGAYATTVIAALAEMDDE